MKKLRDRYWKIGYGSDEDNLIVDFYIPALECALQYDRKAGFFNSTILSRVARGLGALLANQGRMRLIMGCQFSPEDLQAVQQGYALRETLTHRLDQELTPPVNFAQLKHFEILSWLIQNEYLDIRIAIPLKPNGNPESSELVLDPKHLFHEKVGIISDVNGDRLAFNGSNNESIGGWQSNLESFHVFFSWDGGSDLQRVQHECDRFERLWNDELPNVRVFEIPTAVKQKLLNYTPNQKPDWNPQAEFNTSPITYLETINEFQISEEELQKEREQFTQLANIHHHPGCLDFSVKSIPIKPWAHQLKILRRIAAEFPRNALIADEVGLGKTIETGLILRYLLLSKKATRVLILVPASVQPQWQEEMREKFNLHFWSYGKNELVDPYQQSVAIAGNLWNQKNLILASSHLVRRKERMQELLNSEAWDLIVLDEAHHARRKSPQNHKDTPNRLLELMERLRTNTQALLLLSATPMQIDAIEMFDLIKLLGLKGHWEFPDNFCHYFATLSESPNKDMLNFWQTMSTDYFDHGGQPCSKIQKGLETSDRLLFYQLEDIWRNGQKITNPQKYLADDNFISASQRFLATNTPIKDLMFRHTRDTLREYFKRGLLAQDVPIREVFDHAIALEANREVHLYIAVSDYVRHFYRLAQKENRKALGFLMTLYRKRLTSSFYAIEKSLQRRLDYLLTQQGSLLGDDDYSDLEDADDAIIEGLESFMEPIDPKEIEYLQDLLHQFDNTGEDTKRSKFINKLRQEFLERDSAIIFTQYTDTMDYLRDILTQLYGSSVACYSGRGGEINYDGKWQIIPKEEIKRRFRDGEIKILLCTESASEGLNLQTCGVLFNYDMPWNPMRVEQRIGRIDRIGQKFSQVRIHNFYYDGTVEAKVYRKLRDRIQAFTTVVGNLQPILALVPTFIEKAVMSADPLEENVLLSEFEQTLDISPLQPALNDAVAMDVEADLTELRQPIPSSPFNAEIIEQVLTRSRLLQKAGIRFEKIAEKLWKLQLEDQSYQVTFYADTFDEHPSLRLMTFGDPIFELLLHKRLASAT